MSLELEAAGSAGTAANIDGSGGGCVLGPDTLRKLDARGVGYVTHHRVTRSDGLSQVVEVRWGHVHPTEVADP